MSRFELESSGSYLRSLPALASEVPKELSPKERDVKRKKGIELFAANQTFARPDTQFKFREVLRTAEYSLAFISVTFEKVRGEDWEMVFHFSDQFSSELEKLMGRINKDDPARIPIVFPTVVRVRTKQGQNQVLDSTTMHVFCEQSLTLRVSFSGT